MHEKETDILFKDECYQIMGACFEVYKEMGSGFLESVYQECLAPEFDKRNIPYESQPRIQLKYKSQVLKQFFEADFICYDSIILEIKAAAQLVDKNEGQLINYLNGTGFRLGLLVNFGAHPQLEWKRLVK